MPQYISGIHQPTLCKLNLDDRDARILSWFLMFIESGAMATIAIEGETYYWVSYRHVIAEFPAMRITSVKSVSRRFKQYADAGLLLAFVEKSARGTFTYFRPTPLLQSIRTGGEPQDICVPWVGKEPILPTGQECPVATGHESPTPTGHQSPTKDISTTCISVPTAQIETSYLGSITREGVVSSDTPPVKSNEMKDMEIPPSSLFLLSPTSPELVPEPAVPLRYPVASLRPPGPQDYTDEGDRPIRRQMISRSMMSSMIETHMGYDYLSRPLQPPDYLRYECVVFAMAKKYGVITGDNWAKDKAVFEAWFYRVGPQWLDQPRDRARLVEALEVAYEQGIPADRLGEAVKGVPVVTDEEILQRLIHGGSWGMRSDTISLTYMVELWTGVPLPDVLREALLNTTECFQTSLSGLIIAASDGGRSIIAMAEELGYPLYRELKSGDLPRPARKQTRGEDYEDFDDYNYLGISDGE